MKKLKPNQVWDAYKVWLLFVEKQGTDVSERFSETIISEWEKFLGGSIVWQGTKEGGTTWRGREAFVSDETYRRIEMLNSPHWYALLKAHYAVRG